MNDSHIHAQLHQSGRGELLLTLAEMTAGDSGGYAAHQRLAESSDMTERDVLYQLGKLSDADLAVSSGRMSGGWRLTPEGTRIADWMGWELHGDGRTPVALDEREHALDLLEETKYIKSFTTLQGSHVRVEITSLGRTALMRQDVLLTSGLFDHGQATNVDQRIGIQAQTFHNDGGAVQTGDRTVQNITITNTQVERINDGIAATRAVLAREDLDEPVRTEVSAALDELEAAAGQQAETGVLHALITKATMAAAGAAGSAAGGAVIQSLAAIGAAIV